MTIRPVLKPYKCELCGAGYYHVYNLLEHKGVSHVPSGAYKCSHCSCQFERHSSLAVHMGRRHPLHSAVQRLMR
jgi:DNA-directed RNA polymerase subunit RPC12/RpoP